MFAQGMNEQGKRSRAQNHSGCKTGNFWRGFH
jgi:hypothetical protein